MDILNLPSWTPLEVQETDDTYTIKAEYSLPPDYCPRCDTLKPRCRKFGTQEVQYRDLPIHGKKTILAAVKQRFICDECNKTFFQILPDMAEGYKATKRLISYIERESYKRTFASIAAEIGVTETTIRNIFNDHLASQQERFTFITPEVFGIDEVTLLKKPRCVMSNVEERTIYDILPNRNKDTVIKRLKEIPDRKEIRLVCMDMWNPYRDAVRQVLPNATIIVDKFHVVRLANDAMETVRKGMRETLTKRQRLTLKNDRFLLRKRNRDLKPEQRLILETWTKNYPQLGSAYELKESFYEIYDSGSVTEAKSRYKQWKATIPEGMQGAFFPLISAVKNWETEIFAYFHHHVTNAYTESLNGIIKAENRKGRGYSFPVIRGKILYDPKLHKKRMKSHGMDRVAEPGFGNAVLYQQNRSGIFELLGVDISTLIEKIQKEGL